VLDAAGWGYSFVMARAAIVDTEDAAQPRARL